MMKNVFSITSNLQSHYKLYQTGTQRKGIMIYHCVHIRFHDNITYSEQI